MDPTYKEVLEKIKAANRPSLYWETTPKQLAQLASGDPYWWNHFAQQLEKHPDAAAKLYTKESIASFLKGFSPNKKIRMYRSIPSVGMTIANPVVPEKPILVASQPSTKDPSLVQAFAARRSFQPQTGAQQNLAVTRTTSTDPSQLPTIFTRSKSADPSLYFGYDIAAHQGNHYHTTGVIRRPKSRPIPILQPTLKASQMGRNIPINPGTKAPLVDRYGLYAQESDQAAMSANQGRNFLANTLRAFPGAYPYLSKETKRYITHQMPKNWQNPQQAKQWMQRVWKDPNLYRALPFQAKLYYGNADQLFNKAKLSSEIPGYKPTPKDKQRDQLLRKARQRMSDQWLISQNEQRDKAYIV